MLVHEQRPPEATILVTDPRGIEHALKSTGIFLSVTADVHCPPGR